MEPRWIEALWALPRATERLRGWWSCRAPCSSLKLLFLFFAPSLRAEKVAVLRRALVAVRNAEQRERPVERLA